MATLETKLSIEDKLTKAIEFKNVGNMLYKEGNHKAAAGQYHRAILYLKGIDNDLHGTPAFLQMASVDPNHKKHIDKEVEEECIQMNISVYNNLCACLLQLPDSDSSRIKHLAEVVIELDESNEKAWFRRGQACFRQKDFSEAKTCFEKVKELSKGENKEAERWLNNCQAGINQVKEREKKMYVGMFQKTG